MQENARPSPENMIRMHVPKQKKKMPTYNPPRRRKGFLLTEDKSSPEDFLVVRRCRWVGATALEDEEEVVL